MVRSEGEVLPKRTSRVEERSGDPSLDETSEWPLSRRSARPNTPNGKDPRLWARELTAEGFPPRKSSGISRLVEPPSVQLPPEALAEALSEALPEAKLGVTLFAKSPLYEIPSVASPGPPTLCNAPPRSEPSSSEFPLMKPFPKALLLNDNVCNPLVGPCK
uniref:Uncharacterized protein n=1 Tax=Rhipicephalus zambeziensis TaxID=60191 RepID=A0A224Y5W8_9ACAR